MKIQLLCNLETVLSPLLMQLRVLAYGGAQVSLLRIPLRKTLAKPGHEPPVKLQCLWILFNFIPTLRMWDVAARLHYTQYFGEFSAWDWLPHLKSTEILFKSLRQYCPPLANNWLSYSDQETELPKQTSLQKKDTMSQRVFSSLAIDNVYEISIMECWSQNWTPGYSLCVFPTPRMLWQLLKTTKTQFSARISSLYYRLLWRVLFQLLLLPSLPLRSRGVACGMQLWTRVLKLSDAGNF